MDSAAARTQDTKTSRGAPAGSPSITMSIRDSPIRTEETMAPGRAFALKTLEQASPDKHKRPKSEQVGSEPSHPPKAYRKPVHFNSTLSANRSFRRDSSTASRQSVPADCPRKLFPLRKPAPATLRRGMYRDRHYKICPGRKKMRTTLPGPPRYRPSPCQS